MAIGGRIDGLAQCARCHRAPRCKAEESTGTFVYLLSDASKFVTGETVLVDSGGRLACQQPFVMLNEAARS